MKVSFSKCAMPGKSRQNREKHILGPYQVCDVDLLATLLTIMLVKRPMSSPWPGIGHALPMIY